MNTGSLSYTLTREERRLLSGLKAHQPKLEEAFLLALPGARFTGLEKTLQAIARERMGGTISLENEELHWTTGLGEIRAEVGAAGPLGQFQLRVAPEGLQRPDQLLELLVDHYSSEGLERLASELRQSVANLALSRALRALRQQGFEEDNSVAWAAERSRQDPSFATSSFFEQWIFEGHPLHPAAKLRKGLPASQALQWMPEAGPIVHLAIVGVQRDHLRETGETVSKLLLQDYPELAPWAEEWGLLALHPHQVMKVLPKRYQKWLEGGQLKILDAPGLAVRPLMSFRSMAPSGRHRHQLKTAVDIQLTGAVRTVSPNASENGPMLSRVLNQVLTRENRFQGRLDILMEPAAAYFDPPEPVKDRYRTNKSLSLLMRDNPEGHTRPGQVAMPAAALLERAPSGRQLVVEELLEVFSGSIESFLDHYLDLLVEPLLRLLTGYGVALEAHLQNMVMVFDEGRPVKALYRDFGGVRISTQRLAGHGLEAHFHPGSATTIEEPRELHNKLLYPLLINHLGELFRVLASAGKGQETEWWRLVSLKARQALAAMPEEWAKEPVERALFQNPLELKRMTWMRLVDQVTSYTYADIPNPLRGPF